MSQTWMPLGLAIFEHHTSRLTTLEIGAYVLLVKHFKTKPGTLPDNEGGLARIAGVGAEQMSEMIGHLRPLFDVVNGCWVPKDAGAGLAKPPKTGDLFNAGSSTRGSRLPLDWKPSQGDFDYAGEYGLEGYALERIVERFKNYWASAAGSKGVKLDWSATWRNWVSNEAERRGIPRRPGGGVPAANPRPRSPTGGFLAAVGRSLSETDPR